jgi:hypothetical protein
MTNIGMGLTEEMIQTAIEYVETKEVLEEEEAAWAHKQLENAIHQEEALQAIVEEAHHDAEDAEEILSHYWHGDYPEDREMRREMTVADISHQVEDYAQKRLREAKEMEHRAKENEKTALEDLEELQQHEEILKKTLAEVSMAAWDKKLELKEATRETAE